MLLRSPLLAARHIVSHKYSGPWSHYVIYLPLFCAHSQVRSSPPQSFGDSLKYLMHVCMSEGFLLSDEPLCWRRGKNNKQIQYYIWPGCLTHGCLSFLCHLQVIIYYKGYWEVWLKLRDFPKILSLQENCSGVQSEILPQRLSNKTAISRNLNPQKVVHWC